VTQGMVQRAASPIRKDGRGCTSREGSAARQTVRLLAVQMPGRARQAATAAKPDHKDRWSVAECVCRNE
jgi:hypothetical protein